MLFASSVESVCHISPWDQGSTEVSQTSFLFSGEIKEGWVIRQPISLQLERDEDSAYIISEETFNIYGQGPSIGDAQEDFIVALVEYYEILKQYAEADSASREALERFSRLWLPSE